MFQRVSYSERDTDSSVSRLEYFSENLSGNMEGNAEHLRAAGLLSRSVGLPAPHCISSLLRSIIVGRIITLYIQSTVMFRRGIYIKFHTNICIGCLFSNLERIACVFLKQFFANNDKNMRQQSDM
jgi:hypothetical protein